MNIFKHKSLYFKFTFKQNQFYKTNSFSINSYRRKINIYSVLIFLTKHG